MAWTVHLNGHSTPAGLTERDEALVRANWLHVALGKSLRIDPAAAAIYLEPPLIKPLEGEVNNPFMAEGYPHNPWGRHLGIDIPARQGTPVVAVAAGRVAWAQWWAELGNCVVLEHGLHLTLYAHLYHIPALPNVVDGGAIIGYVGSTGESTGPHLHAESWALQEPLAPGGDPYGWTRGDPDARPFDPSALWTRQRWPVWEEAEPRPAT